MGIYWCRCGLVGRHLIGGGLQADRLVGVQDTHGGVRHSVAFLRGTLALSLRLLLLLEMVESPGAGTLILLFFLEAILGITEAKGSGK